MKKVKRVNNEDFAYELFTSGKSVQQMRRAFKKRYPDATPEFLNKRVKIYRRIAEMRVEKEAKLATASK